MKRIIAWVGAILSLITVVGIAVATAPKASADSNISPLTTKALMQEVYLCYKNGHYKTGGAKLAEYSGYSNLVAKNPTIAIPSVILDNQNGTSCSDLMLGEGIVRGVQNNFKGVLEEAGFSKSATGEAAADMLETLQFKISGDSEDGSCYRMVFDSVVKAGSSIELSTNRICFHDKGSVKVYDEKDDGAKTAFDFSKKVRFSASGNQITLHLSVDQRLPLGAGNNYILPAGTDGCTYEATKITCSRNSGENAEAVLDKFTSFIYALGNPATGNYSLWSGTNGGLTYSYGTSKITIQAKTRAELFSESKMEDKTYALSYKWSGGGNTGTNLTGMDAVAALSAKMGNKITNHSDLKFTKDEMFGFYQNHMVDFWGVSGDNLICDASSFSMASDTTVWHDIKMLVDGEIKQCKAKAGNNAGKSIWAFTDQDYFSSTVKKGFGEVAAWMNENGGDVSAEEVEADTTIPMTEGTVAEDPDDPGNTDPCFNESGALGWTVCPIIAAIRTAMEESYSSWIEPLLQVNGGVLSAMNVDDQQHGIYQAWGVCRDIANVVFVIMLLLVIFSQVTGYGIDNYGIKRLLPRLIVTAVIVNFSFLICQLAVDISNIIGASIQEFLTSIANNIDVPTKEGANKTIGGLLTALVAGFATFKVASIVMPTSFSLVLPILIVFIIAIISALTGLVVLGARQALIVIMVVISPLAFALNMLPNTSSLFTRYRKMFVNLLMVYPAAGLLIGGGYMTARLILSIPDAGFAMHLVGLLLLVVPYFFIIPLVRSSMSAFGNVGNMISNFGRSMRRGAVGGITGSETYKRLNTQLRAAGMDKAMERVGRRNRFLNRTIGRMGAPGKAVAGALTSASTMDLARRSEALDRQEQADIAAEAIMDAKIDPRDDDDTLRTRLLQAQDDRERSVIAQRWEKANRKGFVDSVANMAAANELDAKWAKTYFQNNKDAKNMMEKRNPWADLYVATGGSGGNLMVNGKINKAYQKGLQLNDMTGLSTDAIALGVSTGAISRQLAYETMTSTAPNIQSTIQSDPDKAPILRELANAVTAGGGTSASAGPLQEARAAMNATNRVAGKIKQVQNAKKVTSLSFVNGENVSGQSSGALQGIPPEIGGFNASAAYKEKGGNGRLVLVDERTGTGWDATNGQAISGAELQAAIANSGGSPISRMSGTGSA